LLKLRYIEVRSLHGSVM